VYAARFTALEKTYFSGLLRRKAQRALRGVDLSVRRGAAFGLIGLNGAGKTTLIKTLLGVVHPTAGSVELLGGAPSDPRIRARVGYLPERLHLPASIGPRAFLASVARLKGLGDARADIERQLERVGIGAEAGRAMGGFSKGMKQRVGLAAALLGTPDLLVLDEPSDGVDPLGRIEIRKILVEERARGATLLLNSHLLSETEQVCDRIGILSDGRLVREGSLDALCGSGTRFRVRFAEGANAAALEALGFRAAADGHCCDAADEHTLNRLLDRARATGALLIELRPEMRALEDVLADALGAPHAPIPRTTEAA